MPVIDTKFYKNRMIEALCWCAGKLDENYIEAIMQEDKHTEILKLLAEMKKGE
jgi:hypothetical protein